MNIFNHPLFELIIIESTTPEWTTIMDTIATTLTKKINLGITSLPPVKKKKSNLKKNPNKKAMKKKMMTISLKIKNKSTTRIMIL